MKKGIVVANLHLVQVIFSTNVDSPIIMIYTILIISTQRGQMNMKLFAILGKVIVAAGWADKNLTLEEINQLKDLLFKFQQHLPETREFATFEMYIESPIDAAERERLVNELRESVWSEEDKQLVISALIDLVEADGRITDDERAMLDAIKAKIESVDTSIFGDLGRLLRGAMQRRSESMSNAPNREKYYEDFLKNKMYYAVRRRLDRGEAELKIAEADLRKLSALGGLMARVAQTDGVVIEKETEKIISILQTSWLLSLEAATFVMEVAMSEVSRNFDYLRITRELVETTTPAERAGVLDVLFSVAAADGGVSKDELTEIHRIADYLLLSENRVDEAHSRVAQ
jgi:uncharacterized tellurite resistance protein B-like protein